MKFMRLLVLVFFFLAVFGSGEAEAQCAMCKAVAEGGKSEGSSVAKGLNDGILYLMAFPYILMGVVSVAWYRHNKGKRG